MRHRVKGKRLGRNKDHRKALFKNLITSLILHEEIKTTEAKAKSVKGLTDRLISRAKTGTLHSRRLLASFLPSQEAVAKIMDVLGPRFKNRTSGFTRIIRLGKRKGDQAPIVKMELVEKTEELLKKKGKQKKKEPKRRKTKTVSKEQPQATEKALPTVAPRSGLPSLVKRPSKKGR
jgi:large subunit ribosomal protein L17